MARKATARARSSAPTSYELLARRIQQQILAPRTQRERQAIIARASDELETDWDLLLEQLSEEESVTLLPQEDGSVCLTWMKPTSD